MARDLKITISNQKIDCNFKNAGKFNQIFKICFRFPVFPIANILSCHSDLFSELFLRPAFFVSKIFQSFRK